MFVFQSCCAQFTRDSSNELNFKNERAGAVVTEIRQLLWDLETFDVDLEILDTIHKLLSKVVKPRTTYKNACCCCVL